MKQIDTPAFKRWFGRSKIVDANGKPLVLYHGTTADFTKFSDEFGPYRGGILAVFSTSPKFASDYSSFTSGSRNSNVIPVFLKIENPFDYRKDSWLAESFWDETGGITDGYSINQMVEEGDTLTKEKFVDLVKEGSWAALEAEQFVRYLKEGGYDGIVIKEGGAINYAIFEPTQVKSAYGNRGTFDPDDPDIRNPRSAVSDAAYMDAVRRGDMVTAQRLVDAAASIAGYTIGPVYHGTKGKKKNTFPFTVFDTSRSGSLTTQVGTPSGSYFTPNKRYAEGVANYASNMGRNGKPVVGTFYLKSDVERTPGVTNEIEFFATDPNQIKSADPVTYDDAGNVIPLSQRFNDQSGDIRNPRSAPPQFPYRYAAYLKANFPEIWKAGGNIRGNDTFRWWTAYRQGDRSPTVMRWWNVTRPAWIARHYRDYRLPGVIAQIKWGTVGTLGVAGMKRVVEDAIRKRYG